MTYLPFWQGALVLATVPVLHWAILGRSFAVSGRLTALVDRARQGTSAAPETAMSEADMLAAIRAETQAAFGAASVEPVAPVPSISGLVVRGADPSAVHVLFFVGLALGGLLSALTRGSFAIVPVLRGDLFERLLGHSHAAGIAALFAGGLLVGFGTRMASGCTSGHGLCGVSQLQKGSLVATAAFFGMGVLTSFIVAALS